MARADQRDHLDGLGEFIRAQRRMAELSQRELAKIADVSDAYVSQLERGMHEPTVKVLRSIAGALDVRANTMLRYAGWLEDTTIDDPADDTERDIETAIEASTRLTTTQKEALLAVYRGFVEAGVDD